MNDDTALDAILEEVRRKTGFDLAAHRRPTLARRVRNRMVSAGIADVAEYLRFLEATAAEPARLLDRLTIKVSRFYRNAPAFDLVRDEVLPELARAAGGRALRIWSAGCGRGEEAHTLAMLLEERGIPGSVLATDIDAAALAAAREASYPEAALRELPPALRAGCLVPDAARAGHWRPSLPVRARVEWRIDDVGAAAPAPAIFDLVCCRNVLIYFTAPMQERALRRLVASMAARGYLLLGEAEWPSAAVMPMLATVAQRSRLFRAQPAQRLAA